MVSNWVILSVLASVISVITVHQRDFRVDGRVFKGPKNLMYEIMDLKVTLYWSPRTRWKGYNYTYKVYTCVAPCGNRQKENIWAIRDCDVIRRDNQHYCSPSVTPEFKGNFRVAAILHRPQGNFTKDIQTKYKFTREIYVKGDSSFSPPKLKVTNIRKESVNVALTFPFPQSSIKKIYYEANIIPLPGKNLCNKDTPENNTINTVKDTYPKSNDDASTQSTLINVEKLQPSTKYCIKVKYKPNGYSHYTESAFVNVTTEAEKHTHSDLILIIGVGVTIFTTVLIVVCAWLIFDLRKSFTAFVHKDVPEFLKEICDELNHIQAGNESDDTPLLEKTIETRFFVPTTEEEADPFPTGLIRELPDVCQVETITNCDVTTRNSSDDVTVLKDVIDDVTTTQQHNNEQCFHPEKRPNSYIQIVGYQNKETRESVSVGEPARQTNDIVNGYSPQ